MAMLAKQRDRTRTTEGQTGLLFCARGKFRHTRLGDRLRNALYIGLCCLMMAGCSVLTSRQADSTDPHALLTQPLTRTKRQKVEKVHWWQKVLPQREPTPPKSVRDFMGMKRMDP